ncbi:hypothetical protein [Neobacillus citreus]|uniref:J domain-containing protein n=1 Tax=Neobacillus citreus TaxID=2833578 RepID=A0A942STH0_9BACI|nr:hypothetical protein [Neobacillus citreus]MCH6264637.1 hypothetical protein [Neobacillus citreus]
MNTDQAFELLKSAGVPDELSIQTVRRWMRERKIRFEGKQRLSKTEYILEDTDQAFDLLKDAGVASNIGIQLVKRWYNEGKIHRLGNVDQIKEYLSTQPKLPAFEDRPSDMTIRELKVKLKAQDEQIKGIQELHQTSVKAMSQQRDKLQKEIASLKNENTELQMETKQVLKENIELRKELLRLKEELSKQGRGEEEKIQYQSAPHSIPQDFRRRLGLSKTANPKEVLVGFKKLLIETHPDHGGSAKAFHYIKTDYDQFKNSIKGN